MRFWAALFPDHADMQPNSVLVDKSQGTDQGVGGAKKKRGMGLTKIFVSLFAMGEILEDG